MQSITSYRSGELYCEGVPLRAIAEEFGTPTYVYSSRVLENNFRALDSAFASVPHLICYSLKANTNTSVARFLNSRGAGADIVSGGELFRALRVGMDPHKIVYSGVGKTPAEIEYAIRSDILMFNVESHGELEAINRVAGELGTKARIAVRVNPDIDAKTHPYITTGMRKYKFGVPASEVVGIYRDALAMPNIEIVGIQMHIGSQLVQVQPIVEAMRKLLELIKGIQALGIKLSYIDIGGGLGIRYSDETPEGPNELAAGILPTIKELGCTLILEPGRFIVGNAGLLLSRVLYTKHNDIKRFAIVDAAMNDLIRPALYESYHEIRLATERAGSETVDVVGPVCESGDCFAHDRRLPPLKQDDLLAFLCAGAYGFAMSSNYNSRLRPAEVLVSDDTCTLARKRETYEDLIRGED
jgi:diaminopimelate decarboxylase